jgi:hypothetical protein
LSFSGEINRIFISKPHSLFCWHTIGLSPRAVRDFDTENHMINLPTYDPMSRRMIAVAIYCCALILLLATSKLSSATQPFTGGSSSKQLRKQTVNSLPYHQLNQQTKEKISGILQKPSVYRQLPVTSINADPDYFRFLVRYPEVIVNIWQLMGITNMSTERTGPFSLSTNDGAGTISSLELVYGTDNLHIFYGTGSYEGPIIRRKLHGKCVLVLRTENNIDAHGKPVATCKLDVFLKIENATAGLIAKTIQPLVGTTADHNFVESLKFVQRLNETTSKNGPGVQRMGGKLNIDAKVRQQFNEVVDVVFQRAINASIPADPRTPARPVSLPTSYSAPRPSPSNLNLNPKTTTQPHQLSGYPTSVNQQFNDLGQSQSGYHARNGIQVHYPNGSGGMPQNQMQRNQQHQLAGKYQLPAQGSQAPSYTNPVTGIRSFPYQQTYAQPVRASYDYGQQQPTGNVQAAGGWRPRQ